MGIQLTPVNRVVRETYGPRKIKNAEAKFHLTVRAIVKPACGWCRLTT